MVSVMMPVLAPQPIYFREAVSSLLTQTLTDIELIIVRGPIGELRRAGYRGVRRSKDSVLQEPQTSLVSLISAIRLCLKLERSLSLVWMPTMSRFPNDSRNSSNS